MSDEWTSESESEDDVIIERSGEEAFFPFIAKPPLLFL